MLVVSMTFDEKRAGLICCWRFDQLPLLLDVLNVLMCCGW